MRWIFVAALVLAGCSSQGFRKTGPHEYLITDTKTPAPIIKVFAICKKLGRWPFTTGLEPQQGRSEWWEKVECIMDYEVVAVGPETYRIRATDSQRRLEDTAVSQKIFQIAHDYCASKSRTVVMTDMSVHMAGDQVTFRCDPPEKQDPRR
jgi:hypothetical protein